MSQIMFDHVSKRFGATLALDDLTLTVDPGELLCLLGPSGCGKTTALRILAGFEAPLAGSVMVGGSSIVEVPAQQRGFGMVFQSYSLFPNMTAADNIGFPLKIRKRTGSERTKRVDELLEVTGLTEHAAKYPHQMSGGQQQRVALARAIATEPPVLLLDEPLSALDAAAREQLRDEIRRLQRELGITTVFVTHDQTEAMAIADRMGVMRAGKLVQLGSPAEVYLRPVDAFVSSFLGITNDIEVRPNTSGAPALLGLSGEDLAGLSIGQSVRIRPEHIVVESDATAVGVDAHVQSITFLGPTTRLICVADQQSVIVDVPSTQAIGLAIGDRLRVRADGPMLV